MTTFLLHPFIVELTMTSTASRSSCVCLYPESMDKIRPRSLYLLHCSSYSIGIRSRSLCLNLGNFPAQLQNNLISFREIEMDVISIPESSLKLVSKPSITSSVELVSRNFLYAGMMMS